MWAVLHAIFLFWGVKFPFNYRKLQLYGKIRYAHIISVLLALIFPLVTALIPLRDGFLSTRNPTLACLGRNTDYIYATLILPLSLAFGATSCLLVLTFWIIFKVGISKMCAIIIA